MLPEKKAHATRYDYEEYKQWRDIDDERQRQALENFYRLNSRPHYSKPFRIKWGWGLFFSGIVAAYLAWKVGTFVIDAGLRAFGQ